MWSARLPIAAKDSAQPPSLKGPEEERSLGLSGCFEEGASRVTHRTPPCVCAHAREVYVSCLSTYAERLPLSSSRTQISQDSWFLAAEQTPAWPLGSSL